MLKIIKINRHVYNKVKDFLIHNWGAEIIVTRGKIHKLEKLKGFVALENEKIIGLITYFFENCECEIVSLDSIKEGCGIGTKLVNMVIDAAKVEKCFRVWLITTNDNTKAIRYYQKRGFMIKSIYINAIEESRKLKPAIPLLGNDSIPILHEIEFEKLL